MKKVFISGSISIKKLPLAVQKSIEKIINNKFEILVGDAKGVDSLVQDFCNKKQYHSVIVYTIGKYPRYLANTNFKIKKIDVPKEIKNIRKQQQEKDKQMTFESHYSLVVWDGKSKGSYSNIIRAIENNKKVKVYLSELNDFLPQKKVIKKEIESIFRKNNGYTTSEILTYLPEEIKDFFKRPQDLNKFLVMKNILRKEKTIYLPTDKYSSLFIIEKYRGKTKGIKFKKEFIDWLKIEFKDNHLPKQATLF